jgi:hypothetical protein
MYHKLLPTLTALLFFTLASAQDFAGYRSGNYTGVNGVFFNPAYIADSRYKVDFNLFSVSGFVGNNQASFSLKDITNSFGGDSLKSQLFGNGAGKSSGFVSAAVHGPSLMFNAGRKMAFALTTRARVMANARDIDGKLVTKITDDFSSDPALPYTISSAEDMRFTANGWTEFGFSVARVISDKGKHFFKTGATVKYLTGAANGYFNIGSFNATLNQDLIQQDVYLANTTGRMAVGFGGMRISDLEPSDILKMESTGWGGDIGVVYEFRPEQEKFRTADKKGWMRDKNKYKLKVGVALLDIGKIAYKRDLERSGAYDLNITGNERFYLSELEDVEIDDYKAFFNSRPQYFTQADGSGESRYNVSLPSTLQVDIDYHLHKNLYVSMASQLAVSSKANTFNSRYYNTLTLTPRYEGKGIGLYVPLNYNALTKFNAGASFKFGPLFFGSGSALTALLGSSKQADVHVGLRFGSLQ